MAIAGTTSCISIHRPASMLPTPVREWPYALASAHAHVARGEFDLADTVLARFAARFPGTPEALETAYWRALYRMDPDNHDASMTAAITSLDGYLADQRPRPHVQEARTLRRLAAEVDALDRQVAASASQAREAVAVAAANQKSAGGEVRAEPPKNGADAQAASDAEIKRLKDELAKANAELERIKKRLSQPPPRP